MVRHRPGPGPVATSREMRFRALVRNCVGSIFLVLPVSGCSPIGPSVIPRDRTDYLVRCGLPERADPA